MTPRRATTGPTPTSRGYTGPIPDELWAILRHVWEHPLAIDTDYARQHKTTVALGASMGWLSTITPSGKTYGRRWHITTEGLNALRWKDHF